MRTKEELRIAKDLGILLLAKNTLFYLNRRKNGDLKPPTGVLKAGTGVIVFKLYRKGSAALLRYTDRTGKVWWSWTHAKDA